MLHRAIFGSIERFLGILIEHYAGALPLWLAPVQAAVLPLADRHNEAAHELALKLADAGGRVEDLSRILGHSDIITTYRRYVRPDGSDTARGMAVVVPRV